MKTRVTVMVGLAACVLTMGPRPASAQPAQGQAEVREAADRGDRAEQRGGDRMRARMPGTSRVSEEEMDEVLAFMREHSPNRVKAMESLPEEGAARRGVLAFVLARYRALQAVKDEDAKLYEIKVKQVEIEDELYGLLAPARTVGDREKVRGQIRAVTKSLVEQNLAEREQRLSRLRESLQREEQKLGSDRGQVEAMADTRTSMLVQEGTPALRREMLRHGFRDESRKEGREGREGRPVGAATRPVER